MKSQVLEKVNELTLQDGTLDNLGVDILNNNLARFKGLFQLTLDGNQITDDGGIKLAEACANHETI